MNKKDRARLDDLKAELDIELLSEQPGIFFGQSLCELMRGAIEALAAVEAERDSLLVQLERVQRECASLRERLQCAEVEQEKLQRDVRDRDDWIFLYDQSSDRIGKALESIRQKRWTGEPARSDADEVTDLVHRLQQCEADAARYRWLKTHCSVATLTVTPDTGIHLTDAAIDAALNTETKR